MITKKDEYFYQKALELAEFGEHRVRVGCVSVYKSTIITGTFNTHRNSSFGVPYTDLTTHAEKSCINLMPRHMRSGATLYIARIDQDGRVKPSKPCGRCMRMILEQEIKEMVFWDENLRKVRPMRVTRQHTGLLLQRK